MSTKRSRWCLRYIGLVEKKPKRPLEDAVALAIFGALILLGSLSEIWLVRHSFAIFHLTRGVGDTMFYDASGRPWFRMDEQRHDVPLAQISPHLQKAVIAIEDHRFYWHPGIDPMAMTRALARNLRHLRAAQGGSTLTQQLARVLFLSNTRRYGRKLKEAVLALMLEQQLSKKQIIELYLNRVYLGAGVYGVEPMSQKLFNKPVRSLTLSEAALIAGLIRAPSTLSPWSNMNGAMRRSHIVLTRMRDDSLITAEAEFAARNVRPCIRPYAQSTQAHGGYAKEFLRQQFRTHFGGDHPPDWNVYTTFMPEVQEAAERAIAGGLRRLSIRGLQAALVAVEPSTGNILASVGGHDFRSSPFDRATRSRRQPGSAFKPFVYAAALENGLSPVSMVVNLSQMRAWGPEEWLPRNVNGDTADSLTLRDALLESNNRAAVLLQQYIGSRPVLTLARNLGLRDLPDVPSLALGSGLVSLLELTVAYATFANGGWAVKPRALTRIFDANGSVALENSVERERVISEGTAFQMLSILQDVVNRGTGSAARAHGVWFRVAGKTGTTNDFKDAWFVGFSSSLVAGVWVGFDQPRPISSQAFGSRLALPIWANFMQRTSRFLPPRPFRPPDNLQQVQLCRVSYLRPIGECPTYTEYFKGGDKIPIHLCTIHEGTWQQHTRRGLETLVVRLGKRLRDWLGW